MQHAHEVRWIFVTMSQVVQKHQQQGMYNRKLASYGFASQVLATYGNQSSGFQAMTG
jgi:hypothetical protein